MKHTPGPWRTEYVPTNRTWEIWGPIAEAGMMRVAVVDCTCTSASSNASLIASAPAMASRIAELEAEVEELRKGHAEALVAGFNFLRPEEGRIIYTDGTVYCLVKETEAAALRVLELDKWLAENPLYSRRKLMEEVERLRKALIQTGRNTGAGLGDEVSTDFICEGVPEEVRLVVERLKAENARVKAETFREAAGHTHGPLMRRFLQLADRAERGEG